MAATGVVNSDGTVGMVKGMESKLMAAARELPRNKVKCSRTASVPLNLMMQDVDPDFT
ncbi:MAG: hypothetical protein HQK66_15265 [Desulfamplus sp.]|nr:hypothetical protein [Desulfamplus sp.]